MYYDSMPLYPTIGPGCERDRCVRLPMFDEWRGQGGPPGQCRRVTFENPCRPGERVEVLLGVDDCGNLTVCVHQDGWRPGPCDRRERCLPPPCPPEPCRPRPPRREGCDGRLYGSWR